MYSLDDPAIFNKNGLIVCEGCIGCVVKDKFQRHPSTVHGALGLCKRLKNKKSADATNTSGLDPQRGEE